MKNLRKSQAQIREMFRKFGSGKMAVFLSKNNLHSSYNGVLHYVWAVNTIFKEFQGSGKRLVITYKSVYMIEMSLYRCIIHVLKMSFQCARGTKILRSDWLVSKFG